MFNIGSGRYQAPQRENVEATLAIWQPESSARRDRSGGTHIAAERESVTAQVRWRLQQGCLDALPHNGGGTQLDSVRLIDVVWVTRGTTTVSAAFEVEHSTTIYSGIVRMLDLALSVERDTSMTLFLVAPDARRDEVEAQLQRPAFSRVTELGFRYLPYSELQNHRDAMARFGSGLQPLLAASQRL